MSEYKLPEKLQNYINEQMFENSTIHMVNDKESDAFTWIIIPAVLKNWIILVQWYPGEDSFNIVNLQGATIDYLKQLNVK